jgi:hypothetical protein
MSASISTGLPRVLVFEPPQSSISVERALKGIKNLILACHNRLPEEELDWQFTVAMDDLNLLISAVGKEC